MKLRHSLLSMLLLGTGIALAGCETFDLESIWNSKKPLPGERRDMFPQGVQETSPQAPPQQQQSGSAWPEPPARTAQPQQSGPAWPDPPRAGTTTR
jgi:hypothetical protein